jgi:polysaccharide export outer membrane protein
MKQETALFEARRNELLRQTAALTELTNLEKAEIDVLAQKASSLDDQVAQAEEQLKGVKQLVGKGIATVSRQSDLERALAGLRSDRLDNQIATMSAQQALNEAMRNIAKLEDNYRAEVSDQLGTEEANLTHLQLNQMTTQRLITQATDLVASAKAGETAAQAGLSFVVVRPKQGGGATTIAATESTALAPGDLVKVTLQNPPGLPGDATIGDLGLAGVN